MGTPALSADFQKGQTAYRSGDYATAMQEWKPLAEQGDAIAQNNLGLMYSKGQGVPLDFKTAVKWFRLAAEHGYKTLRGRRFFNKHFFSILKRRIRGERLKALSEDRFEPTSPLRIEYIDRMLFNKPALHP